MMMQSYCFMDKKKVDKQRFFAILWKNVFSKKEG